MVGRPRQQLYDIKKNKTRWTIRPAGGSYWQFLPFKGIVNLKTFLLDVDAIWNPIEGMSSLIRGEVVQIKVPANREAHFRSIYKRGAEANPYKKVVESIRDYVLEASGLSWPLEYNAGLSFSNLYSKGQYGGTVDKRLPNNTSPGGKFGFNPELGALILEVNSSKEHSYSGRAYQPYTYDMDGRRLSKTKGYVCRFHWPNWDELISVYKDKLQSVDYRSRGAFYFEDFFNHLMYKQPVQIDCNCGYFHWWGSKELLRQKNVAINDNSYPVGKNAPYQKIAQLSHMQFPLCKHLYWAAQVMFRGGKLNNQKEKAFKHGLQSYLDKNFGFLVRPEIPEPRSRDSLRPDIQRFLKKQDQRKRLK